MVFLCTGISTGLVNSFTVTGVRLLRLTGLLEEGRMAFLCTGISADLVNSFIVTGIWLLRLTGAARSSQRSFGRRFLLICFIPALFRCGRFHVNRFK
jgi:hypothetical protein